MTPYNEANDYLLTNLETILTHLYPQGKREGPNFLVGDVNGVEGQSFVITLEPPAKRGQFKDFAHNERASRNLCQLWKEARGIPKDNHSRFFGDLSAFAGRSFGYNGAAPNKAADFDWPRCVREFARSDAERLAFHPKRQYQPETILWLNQQKYVGLYRGHVTFAMRDESGNVVGVNRWFEDEGKWKFIKSPTLLVIGDPATATELHIHESINDLVAMIDRTGWYLDPTKLFFTTWGASNSKLVRDRVPTTIEKICVWQQNDQPDPKTGRKPNEDWQRGLAKALGRAFHLIRIPEKFEDLNDATVAGATDAQLAFTCAFAALYSEPPPPEKPQPKYEDLPQHFPPADKRPCYGVYDQSIKINDREYKAGVYRHTIIEHNDREFPQDTWLCTPLRVLARTATSRDRDFGRLLEYRSSNGITRRWSMPMELLAGDGGEVLSRLLRDGLEVGMSVKKEILEYIAQAPPPDFLRCATQTGWHSLGGFVLTEEIIETCKQTP